MDCELCEHSRQHGWFGPKLGSRTHCKRCHRTWGGTREAHCDLCHRHFGSLRAFDAHFGELPKWGPRECFDPGELLDKHGKPRFVLRERNHGPTWIHRVDGEHPFARGGAKEASLP